ncbi:MAG TPA: M50 family metallopeptidase [Actinomycetota bacterium]|jgi:membrane-associated protease RseP (regulator of RpoE activity)|nr:M50 family metallopeptidase [Actinomycetota bacterium]
MTLGVVLFVVWILLMVMIHESGHFVVAKLFHFKASQFFLGFGPTLWSTQKGETEYGVKALPLGGFVKIVGMNPYEQVDAKDEPRSYPNKPRWQRALVLLAGSGTHWILAFVTLLIAAMVLGFPNGRATNQVSIVQQTLEGRPTAASNLGLHPNDRIVGIAGQSVTHWSQIRGYIRLHPGDNVTFSIVHNGAPHDVSVRLGEAIVKGRDRIVAYAPAGQTIRAPRAGEQLIGYLGVQPKLEYQKYSLISGAGHAAVLTWDYTKYSVQQVGGLFHTIFSGELWSALSGHGSRGPGQGPVSIYGAGRIAGQTVADHKYLDLVGLLVGLTIFLGIMNLLPLPPLDGGHLAVVVYESITRRTVDLRKLIPVAAAVISFFILIFIASLYLDIIRPLNLPL